MFKVENGKIFFSSGRTANAYGNVIGLTIDAKEVLGGYDDHISDDLGEFTQDEREELADYMISRWQKFKDDK